ncbi:MAG TPA: hypothetical protein VE360_11690 [Pyrinomonadaceae bacterium]|nr:hypothetical protein [Pyrinomonadaceae bacterium]
MALFLPAAAGGQARPGPSVVAGARRLPDISFARRAKRGCDRYVSTAGDDANSGRSVRGAWRTIGMALRTLRAGQVGCVLPGTYEEGHNEAGHDGTAAGPIVLRRAPGSRAMPVVKPKGTVAVFHIDRDISRAHRLDVYDNTLRNIPRAGFRAGVNNSTGVPDRDIDFWGNRIGPAARWLNLGTEASQLEGFASDRNLFVGDTEDAARFYLNGKFVSLREWQGMSGTAPVLVANPRGRVRRAAAQR